MHVRLLSIFTDKSGNKFDVEFKNIGEITINGNVTMGSGSTINWANVNEQNTQWNQAYQVSTNALNTANTANSNAMTANNNASTAQSTAASAHSFIRQFMALTNVITL